MTAPDAADDVTLPPGLDRREAFTSVEEEYAALRRTAGLVDRSARLRMIFAGPQAAEALTGLVTNDVLSLRPGMGQYAVALTAKGKVIADVRIFARADDLLADTPATAGPGFAAMIRKFVNPRLAKYAEVSAVLRTIGVFGPRARGVIAGALGADPGSLASLSPFHHMPLSVGGERLHVAAVPDLGVEGYDVFVPVEAAANVWAALADAGAAPAGTTAVDIVRVEAGRPLWGVDMDEGTLAPEASFDLLGAISYTKGCYTGQETVARVHFRGHVNRHLRGLTSNASIPRGAQLFAADGQPCGDVRSSVTSPRLGPLAIGMVRREVEAGSAVTARWDGGEGQASVRELPFEK
jgi:folate-binding protein YgfZ